MRNYAVYYGLSITDDLSDRLAVLGNPRLNLERIYHFSTDKNYSEITCSASGYGTVCPFKDRKEDLESDSRVTAKRHRAENDNCFLGNVAVLDSIISFAREKKIKVLFFTAPAYKSYTDLLDGNQLNRTISTMENLCKPNGNVYYYNFLKDDQLLRDDFFDADHLDDIGARKFTKQIDSLLKVVSNY